MTSEIRELDVAELDSVAGGAGASQALVDSLVALAKVVVSTCGGFLNVK
jgi:hypothetical protein